MSRRTSRLRRIEDATRALPDDPAGIGHLLELHMTELLAVHQENTRLRECLRAAYERERVRGA